MRLKIKKFEELTTSKLYDLLKLRVNVFVVEQNCAYEEIDDLDKDALHLWYESDDEIKAYLRILNRDEENQEVSIGRVIAVERRKGLGSSILKEAINISKEKLNAKKIYLEAQTYAKGLYEKQGFRQISEEFLLDGIEHVEMVLEV